MCLVTAKLEDTAAHVVALSILLLNLQKIQVRFFTISGLAARLFATVRKTEGCSVDIIIKTQKRGPGSRNMLPSLSFLVSLGM